MAADTDRQDRLAASRARRQEEHDRAAAQARARILPHGNVEPRIWEALSEEWRAKINRWEKTDRDPLGAQVQRAGDRR